MTRIAVIALVLLTAIAVWFTWLYPGLRDSAALGQFRDLRAALGPGTPRAAVVAALAARHIRSHLTVNGRTYDPQDDRRPPQLRPRHPDVTLDVAAGRSLFCTNQRVGTISFDGRDRVSGFQGPYLERVCW